MTKRTIIYNCLFISILIVFCLSVSANQAIFTEIERKEFKLNDFAFSTIEDVDPLPDGYMLMIQKSPRVPADLIVKVNNHGIVVCHYQNRGNGPGQFSSLSNLIADEKFIYACESNSAFIHKFDHNLRFIEDIRIKKGGKLFDLGKYFGVWTITHSKNKKYMLDLYEKKSFTFVRNAFEVKKIPSLVQYWGGVCIAENNKIAGIYSNEYQIKIFNPDLAFQKEIISDFPDHIKKYHPNEERNGVITNKSLDWLKTWSTMSFIFYSNGKYLVEYTYNDKYFFDIYSGDGKLIKCCYQLNRKSRYLFNDQQYFYRIELKELDDENYECFIIKDKLNIN